MTIGQLSRRTGVSVKALRRYEDMGLVYSLGRSSAGYRLFDRTALWCVDQIQKLRGLGLTEAQIRHLEAVRQRHPDQPIGPHLAAMLEQVRARVDARLNELRGLRQRIDAFETRYRQDLAGRSTDLFTDDPERAADAGLDPPPGCRPYGR